MKLGLIVNCAGYDEKCFICGWKYNIHLHHIDKNHDNIDINNLIGLCSNHHILSRSINTDKVNREKLIEFLSKFKLD